MPFRALIAGRIRGLVGAEPPGGPLDHGDAGLFGPGSAAWKVHGDFTAMMVGGVTALLLQMLHPVALAGVWAHSNFRNDMAGRLRRTAGFIAGTTYGSTDRARTLIDQVRAIHDQVNGVTDEGVAYSANDPDLLTWIHVCEVSSFLASYLRYRNPAFPPADQDRYYAEVATIAQRLGAGDVPRSRAAVADYLRAMRPALLADDKTRDVARAILSAGDGAGPAGVGVLFMQAAQDLLPPWAAQMHGLQFPARRRPVVRLGVGGMGAVFRWALTNGAETRARRRVAAMATGGGEVVQKPPD